MEGKMGNLGIKGNSYQILFCRTILRHFVKRADRGYVHMYIGEMYFDAHVPSDCRYKTYMRYSTLHCSCDAVDNSVDYTTEGLSPCQQPKQEAISSCPASASITSIASFPVRLRLCFDSPLHFELSDGTNDRTLHLPCLSHAHCLALPTLCPCQFFTTPIFLKNSSSEVPLASPVLSPFFLQRWMPRCHPPSAEDRVAIGSETRR